jgi:hypothetical protein
MSTAYWRREIQKLARQVEAIAEARRKPDCGPRNGVQTAAESGGGVPTRQEGSSWAP